MTTMLSTLREARWMVGKSKIGVWRPSRNQKQRNVQSNYEAGLHWRSPPSRKAKHRLI